MQEQALSKMLNGTDDEAREARGLYKACDILLGLDKQIADFKAAMEE